MTERPALHSIVRVRNHPGLRRVAGKLAMVVAHHEDGIGFRIVVAEAGGTQLTVDPYDVDLVQDGAA